MDTTDKRLNELKRSSKNNCRSQAGNCQLITASWLLYNNNFQCLRNLAGFLRRHKKWQIGPKSGVLQANVLWQGPFEAKIN